MTICEQLAEEISLHATGEASAAAEAHLAICGACRERHAELRALCDALEAVPDIEPPLRFSWRRAFWPLAVAASILLALWTGHPVPPTPGESKTAAVNSASALPPPTWLSYELAAGESDEALEALLDLHAASAQRPLAVHPTTFLLTDLHLEP